MSQSEMLQTTARDYDVKGTEEESLRFLDLAMAFYRT